MWGIAVCTGFIVERVTGELEGELDLTVMIALVPNHVLQQEQRVVVMEVHRPAGADAARDGGSPSEGQCASGQFTRPAATGLR